MRYIKTEDDKRQYETGSDGPRVLNVIIELTGDEVNALLQPDDNPLRRALAGLNPAFPLLTGYGELLGHGLMDDDGTMQMEVVLVGPHIAEAWGQPAKADKIGRATFDEVQRRASQLMK